MRLLHGSIIGSIIMMINKMKSLKKIHNLRDIGYILDDLKIDNVPPLSGFDCHNIHSKNIHSKSLTHQSEPEKFKQAKSIIWKIVLIGIISALIGACIGVKAILLNILFLHFYLLDCWLLYLKGEL